MGSLSGWKMNGSFGLIAETSLTERSMSAAVVCGVTTILTKTSFWSAILRKASCSFQNSRSQVLEDGFKSMAMM